MKTYQIVTFGGEENLSIEEGFHQRLQANGFTVSSKPKMVISIGGDGTMLEAFKRHYSPDVKFVSLNGGTLGFYSDWTIEQKEQLITNIIENQSPQIAQFSLIEIIIEYENKQEKTYLALNDFRIQGKFKTFICDLEINGEMFEHFRGGGINISTPIGSTASNLSAGGAITHPSLRCIQITGITPINNVKFRSIERGLVLPKHHAIVLYPRNPQIEYLVGYDATELPSVGVKKITARVAPQEIQFLRYVTHPFWNRVRTSFLEVE